MSSNDLLSTIFFNKNKFTLKTENSLWSAQQAQVKCGSIQNNEQPTLSTSQQTRQFVVTHPEN